jgi:O-antigen ligase
MIGGLASALLAIGLPAYGKHGADHPGAWKGIYDYKNTFGSMMVLGAVSFLLMHIERPIERVFKWVGLAFCTAMVLLTTSKTALILLIVIASMLMFYRKFRWQGKLSVILLDLGILLMGCIVTALLGSWIEIVNGLGKDPTLSGRTFIWQVVGLHFWEKPWFGFGRGAFWAPGSRYPMTAAQFFGDRYIPPHAHNGFIDTALDIGLIGLALFLVCFVAAYICALRRAYAAHHAEELFPLAFLTFLAINNMTESYLLRLSNVYFVLFIVTTLTLRRRWQFEEEEDLERNLPLPKYGELQVRED